MPADPVAAMRLFWAIALPPPVTATLDAAGEALERACPGDLRRVPPAGFHLTCRFVGEVLDATAATAAGYGLPRPGPLELRLGGVGHFGGATPEVAFVAVGGDDLDTLRALVAALDGALRAQGLPGERRRFVPHVTLARRHPGAGRGGARRLGAALDALHIQPVGFTVTELVLLESSHGRAPGPSVYTPHARASLIPGD